MIFIIYSFLGLFTGFCAGLFGLGGGIIIVPSLFVIFSYLGLESALYTARNTAMMLMLGTSILATFKHNQHGNVRWDIAANITPVLIVSVFIGHFASYYAKTELIELLFSLFLFTIALKKFVTIKVNTADFNKKLSKFQTIGLGSLVGFKSGLFGVGGGSLSVLALNIFGLPMVQAVATSSAFTFLIALIDNIYGLTIFNFGELIINWSALSCILPTVFIGIYIGVPLANKLQDNLFSKLFSGLLVLISSYLFVNSVSNW